MNQPSHPSGTGSGQSKFKGPSTALGNKMNHAHSRLGPPEGQPNISDTHIHANSHAHQQAIPIYNQRTDTQSAIPPQSRGETLQDASIPEEVHKRLCPQSEHRRMLSDKEVFLMARKALAQTKSQRTTAKEVFSQEGGFESICKDSFVSPNSYQSSNQGSRFF